MTIGLHWRLHATTLAEMVLNDLTLTDVIQVVHWECFATDSDTGQVARIYGAEAVPPPTGAADFIDLSDLTGLPEQERRDTVLAWAESVRPGMVAAVEAATVAKLEACLAEPVRGTVSIL